MIRNGFKGYQWIEKSFDVFFWLKQIISKVDEWGGFIDCVWVVMSNVFYHLDPKKAKAFDKGKWISFEW